MINAKPTSPRLVRSDEARKTLFANLDPAPSRSWWYSQVKAGLIPSRNVGGFIVYDLAACREALGLDIN